MKRKFFVLLLICITLCAPTAFALETSEIVLVGGVQFGMTTDEVMTTLQSNGCEPKLYQSSTPGTNWSQILANTEARGMTNPVYISVYDITVNGHAAYASYYFDTQDQLISVEIDFSYKSSSTSKTRTTFYADQYTELETLLTEKYGEPTPQDIELMPRVFTRKSGQVKYNPIQHAYRLAELTGGSALYIEHFFCDRIAPNGMTYETHMLGYTLHDSLPPPPDATAAPSKDWGI